MAAKVLIVEDHDLLAQSVTFALRADGIEAERVGDLTEDGVLAAVDEQRPDVVLLDLHLDGEGRTSIPLIGPLRERGCHVVMVTGVSDRALLGQCIEAGALGIVSKSASFEHLVATVREATELQSLLSTDQRDELLDELRRQRREEQERFATFNRLTPREQQVLAALMDGLSADAIAADWVVSLATVRSQIRSVLLKLGVNSQLAAVALARRAGWELQAP